MTGVLIKGDFCTQTIYQKDAMWTRREPSTSQNGTDPSFPPSAQKEPALTTPWAWTSSPQNCEMINSWSLYHLVCGTFVTTAFRKLHHLALLPPNIHSLMRSLGEKWGAQRPAPPSSLPSSEVAVGRKRPFHSISSLPLACQGQAWAV